LNKAGIGADIAPLAPIHFFRLSLDIKEGEKASSKLLGKGYLLPDMTELLGEDHFADVGVAWNKEGLFIHVHVHKQFEEAIYPKFTEGDAIELFFDTRDLKEAGFPTRFCHHFLILPQDVQGVRVLELTRFRTEDSHPLYNPDGAEKIEINFRAGSRDYFLDLFFPAEVLHGYDPGSSNRLGLTYTVHRYKKDPQNFAVSSHYVSIAQNPSLWASCRLMLLN
jgi:hypothetical protein